METIAEQFLSSANFHFSWLQVSKKKGCAGSDGETIAQFKQNLDHNLANLRNAIANSNYQPAPYQQILIAKENNKQRELKVPSVRDRIAQQALLNVLSPLIEPKFSDCSFAYRPNISYIQAVEKIAYWRDVGYQWVLDADIVKFFDNIDHNRLLIELRKHINHPGILYLIKSWITTKVRTNGGLVESTKGIPQGAVISPLLANIYLDEFDRTIDNSDLQLVRYADDFVILAKSPNRIRQAYVEVAQFLHGINLELHPQKTRITNFQQRFVFLGHEFVDEWIIPADKPKEQNIGRLVKRRRKGDTRKRENTVDCKKKLSKRTKNRSMQRNRPRLKPR